MKISYNWLKEYLPAALTISPEQISEYLTDSGLEVEGVEKIEGVKGGLEGLVIGKVLDKQKHPDADKLSLTKVDVGTGEILDIVCGAPNVAAGQKVVVATVGAKLYPTGGEPFVIKKSKIRGADSVGMICAEDEIGLGTDHNGIMILDDSAVVGQPAKEYFNIQDDYLIEIGLTPNRADAMSHFGVARDLVAVVNVREGHEYKQVQLPASMLSVSATNHAGPIAVSVENTEKCPRYCGVYISGITVKPSPEWLQNRLRTIGLRPINNVVDVTNYICHSLGQPMHAFDAEEIEGNAVIVKTLADETPFVTLDGVERKLSENDLMICNSKGGMCIAGVFGGAVSGVKDSTTSIFLESAYFNPVTVRKTAKRFGLSTDSSFRFERGVDPDSTLEALNIAANLILELAGGEITGDAVDINSNTGESGFLVEFDLKRCHTLIGEKIPAEKVSKIFDQLQIRIVRKNEDQYQLHVPAYRVDVRRECDIIEEILRIVSFNSVDIPEKVANSIAVQRKPEPEVIYNIAAGFLASNGFNETMSNSLTRSAYAEWASNSEVNPEKSVSILNPLSTELDAMRQTLLFNGLENIAFNLNRRNDDLKFFEYGKTYHKKAEKSYYEEYHLALFLTGNRYGESWRNPSEKAGFNDLKETIITLLNRLGIYKGASLEEVSNPWFEYAAELQIARKPVVTFGKISRDWQKKFDVKQEVFYADFKWDTVLQLLSFNKTGYSSLPKFPSVRRDLSLLLDQQVTFGQIETIARKQEKKLLRDINLFDVYQGKNLEKGKKSYAVSFILQDEEKTLTDQLVEGVMSKIQQALESELGASLRG
ncbi:MAG: phenylalanine--tRNA ligase subunit beta [Bacteroidota bacterium]